MNNEVELTKDINEEDSIYSIDEEDEETKESIRSYIG